MLKSTFITISPIILLLCFLNEDREEVKQEVQLNEIETVEVVETLPQIDKKEIQCMAMNIYHEARNESELGQVAVANVTINRASSKRFPDTICSVVYQARMSKWWKQNKNRDVPIRNACQFSWYCDGKSDVVREVKTYEEIEKLAEEVLQGLHNDNTYGSTHYHAHYVSPYWASSLVKVSQVDSHIFYTSANR